MWQLRVRCHVASPPAYEYMTKSRAAENRIRGGSILDLHSCPWSLFGQLYSLSLLLLQYIHSIVGRPLGHFTLMSVSKSKCVLRQCPPHFARESRIIVLQSH
jgi:hypothetical protein